MTERHSKQNRFAGSIMKQRSRRGGLSTVTERDVLGGGDDMIIEPSEGGRLARKDIGGFSRATQTLLMEIVNDFNVRCRVIDGQHVMLYPPDGTSRPFKVSAERQDKVNKQILEVQFMQEFGLVREPAKKAEPAVEEEPEVTTAVVEEAPVEQRDCSEHDAAIRNAINILTGALGIEALEAEALEALEQVDALTAKVRALEGDLARARSLAEAEQRNATNWKDKAAEFETLADEAVHRAQKAEAKISTLKELFQ